MGRGMLACFVALRFCLLFEASARGCREFPKLGIVLTVRGHPLYGPFKPTCPAVAL